MQLTTKLLELFLETRVRLNKFVATFKNINMSHHEMKLQPDPFHKIVDGSKRIELRLYDEKRKDIELGDTVTFLLEPDKVERVETKVTGLLRYPDFKTLIEDFPVEYFGGKTKEGLVETVRQFYTIEQEKENGVLGIRIEKV